LKASAGIGHAGVAFAMNKYVQAGLEADREMANMLAELIIGGSPPSRWPVITDDAVRAPPRAAAAKPGRSHE
jgi:hypothetical protein